jgi:autotransporter-associated beta strand protein
MKPSSLLHASVLAALSIVGTAHATPTIAGGNGSFETTTAPADQALNWWQWGLQEWTINGWTVTNPDGSAFSGADAPWFCNSINGNGSASDGQFFVNVESGVKWRLKASLEGLVIGTNYTVSFDTRSRGGSGNFDISVDTSTPAGGFNQAPTSTTTWSTQSFTFVAEAETHILTISNQDTVGLGFYVDKFAIAETPPDPWTPGDGIWTGGGLDNNWNTAANWDGGTIGQGIDQSATFNSGTPVTATVNVNRPIGALFFSGANHTLAAGTGSLTLDGDTIYTTPTVTVASGFTATITATLSGTEGLLKSGTGTLVLSGPSAYSGTTEITAGTLRYQGGSYASETHTIASGAVLEFNVSSGTFDAATTTINGAGTLRKTGAGTLRWPATVATFALEPGALIDVQEGTLTAGSFGNESWSANFSDLNVAAGATFNTVEANVRLNKITGSGTLASGWLGAGYQNLTIGVDDGSSTFNGPIANANAPANLVKAGTGTITLAGTNTYTGNTTINDGTLELAAGAQLAFVVSDSTSNTVTGIGIATIKGNFTINTDAVTGTNGGIWTLVDFTNLDPLSAIDPATFTVIGFDDADNNGIWTMSDAKGDWSFDESTGELTLDVGTDYDDWGTPYGLAAGSEGGDLDADGLTNFEEYAFGLIPNSGSSVNPIIAPLNKTSGTFIYTRRLQSKTDLIYTVRSSTTLATDGWTNLVKDTDYTESVAPEGDLETVTITLTPAPTSDKLFIQVKAETP